MPYWVDGRPVGRLAADYQRALASGQTSRTFEEYVRAPAGSHPNAAPAPGSSWDRFDRPKKDNGR